MKPLDQPTVKIDTFTPNGYGLGTLNGLKVFVIGSVPGDVVTIKIKKKKKRHAIATVTNFITTSPLRETTPCTHFPECGGCQIIDINYDKQLTLKETLFKDNIKHTFPNTPLNIQPIIASQNNRYYRNKMEFAFGYNINKEIILGLKKRGHYDTIIETTQCQLQDKQTHQLIQFFKLFFQAHPLTVWDYHTNTGCLCHLMVRHSKTKDTFMIQLNVTESHPQIYQTLVNKIAKKFPNLVSIFLKMKTTPPILLYGKPTITENIGKLSFNISPQSFFQPNSKQAETLYNEVKKASALTGTEIVYDLYCGTGTIGLYLANKAKHIYGIEEVPQAIQNAIKNATKNNITNVHFLVGRVKNKLKEIIEGKNNNIPKPDCIIIDPPRSGIVPKALNRIIQLKPKKIVYVSCNPDTLLRDIQELLSANYKITNIQPIDMFPNTFHLEVVTTLIISPNI